MESVFNDKKQSGFSKKKALAIALSIFAVAIIVSEPVYASTPWYIGAIGAVAGGIIGSLTGSPIGTIAGAAAGAALADYLYSITHKDSQIPAFFPNQNKIELQYISSYENLTSQEMVDSCQQSKTALELFTEDYYYNAQQQEAIVPYFLGNSSLNEFNISLASGTYATINNVSNSIYSPVDTVLYQTWKTGTASCNNGFTTDQIGQTYSYGNGQPDANSYLTNGISLTAGNYMFMQPQNVSTTLFKWNMSEGYLNLTNFYTGKTYKLTDNGILQFNTSKIPYGLYLIDSVSSNIITSGIEILPSGALDTSFTNGGSKVSYLGSAGFTSTPNSATQPVYSGFNLVFSNETMFSSNEMGNSGGYFSSVYCGILLSGHYETSNADYNLYAPAIRFNGMPNDYTSFESDLNNIFSAANSYFTTLHNLGYTNINQMPANQIIPFPSDVVPSSMLNQTFNFVELEEMYIAYLNDLNTTFHNATLFNGKNFTKYVNQSMFVNGFLTVYGNLTYGNATVKHYVNQTDFFIQTYTNKLTFIKGQTTNLTGEIYPVLILNGSKNGTLLYVDASIYVINLQLAGKNITSYTLEPEEITYVLPKTVNVSPVNDNPIFNNVSNFLEKYYLILTVIIAIAVIAYIYERKKPDSKGKGKE